MTNSYESTAAESKLRQCLLVLLLRNIAIKVASLACIGENPAFGWTTGSHMARCKQFVHTGRHRQRATCSLRFALHDLNQASSVVVQQYLRPLQCEHFTGAESFVENDCGHVLMVF